MTTGSIWLAATPIGNADDASPRLRHLLEHADLIAAEDTRRLRALCSRLGVSPTGEIIAVHDHNEASKAEGIVSQAAQGSTVLLVSDAGTPTVSDPGFRVVQVAIGAGVAVHPLPGPSAALAALSVSGLPSDRFAFEGFLPRKTGEILRRLESVRDDPRTLIWFESPKRLRATLEHMGNVLGADRPAAVCRELTKTYEEVVRGSLEEVLSTMPEEPRGEITIVTAGYRGHMSVDEALPEVQELAEELGLKEACAQVAQRTGLRKNALYKAALKELA